jgi:hypothetical protein
MARNPDFFRSYSKFLFPRMISACSKSLACIVFLNAICFAEPVVLVGKMVPSFLGKRIANLRVVNHSRACIPFQIDQVDSAGDYVCPSGKEPNAGNGILDTADEIVFLWEDADSAPSPQASTNEVMVAVRHDAAVRYVGIISDSTVPVSDVSYIKYDDVKEKLTTPYYYACFGHDRFHFTSAGVMDFAAGSYVDLTNELRIRIFCKGLWGLLPISYTENNIICLVKRYKAGPVRLIRRGDFHLNLGFFLKNSHAAVNQICYPQMVRVPVYVHLPVRLRTWFREAYIEMTPVLRREASGFLFDVPSQGISMGFTGTNKTDTLISVNPNHSCMSVHNSSIGYGWLLDAAMDPRYLDGSGYLFRTPSERGGIGHCGFRLTVRDLPKGYYLIGNWVLFSKAGIGPLTEACNHVVKNALISVSGNQITFYNQLSKVQQFRKR